MLQRDELGEWVVLPAEERVAKVQNQMSQEMGEWRNGFYRDKVKIVEGRLPPEERERNSSAPPETAAYINKTV